MEKSDAMAAIMNQQGRVSPGTAAPAEGRSCSRLSPWVFLVSALAVKTALVTVGLVVLFHRSCGQYKTLPQNAPEWHCVPNVSASKRSSSPTEDSWMCCPEGWRCFQESCYYFSADRMPWDESQQNCSGMGSHLVVINTEAEQEFLFSSVKGLVTNTYETKYYIGLTAHKNGQWQWVDWTPYNRMASFWKPGEPNLLFAEKCAAIHVKGNTDSNTYSNWNNILCSTSCYRICELAVKFV
ncbi:C-type lectin domain family 6 member A-like [Cygnus atratus]|uniref:C-type lectin domain family 6 member A-like n=1 Tax=Cygnus atratus TaxID=8868 RepID=UPI0015D63F5B|nr:C-type lectin domain family 6 member A-like [Cygnus atratus]